MYIKIFILSSILSLTSIALAAPGGSSSKDGGPSLLFGILYGGASIDPAEVNTAAGQQSTTPKYENITRQSFYGGFIDYRVFSQISVRASYTTTEASKFINTSNPIGTDGGFKIKEDVAWGGLNWYFYRNYAGGSGHFLYTGASIGYSMNTEITRRKTNIVTDYVVTPSYYTRAQVGIGFNFGERIVISAEGGYNYAKGTVIRERNNNPLKASNKNATLDMSGPYAFAALAVGF